jgi:tellurite resistance-related uncharacterized protein
MSETILRSPARALPDGAEHYRSTAVFTEATVPRGLLADHFTKAGVWGRITVLSGKLSYLISDPRRETFSVLLDPHSAAAIIEPTILHRVEPVGRVAFQVDFFRSGNDCQTQVRVPALEAQDASSGVRDTPAL